MRLKNGMSAEEIKNELLDNSIKKNDNRQIQTNLLYSKDLEYTTDSLFDNGNYLLPASAIKDYILYKDITIYNINDYTLKQIIPNDKGEYDSDILNRIYLSSDSKRFVSKIKVILNLKNNQLQGINNNFEYVIDTRFYRDTIWHKDIAVGYVTLTNNKNYFCLFVKNNNEIIVFSDNPLDNINITIEIEG